MLVDAVWVAFLHTATLRLNALLLFQATAGVLSVRHWSKHVAYHGSSASSTCLLPILKTDVWQLLADYRPACATRLLPVSKAYLWQSLADLHASVSGQQEG